MSFVPIPRTVSYLDLPNPAFFEPNSADIDDPDEEWKRQLRKKINDSLNSMVQDLQNKYVPFLKQEALSPKARASLEKHYQEAMDNLNIQALGDDQYHFELTRERNQRRMFRLGEVYVNPTTLTEEWQNVMNCQDNMSPTADKRHPPQPSDAEQFNPIDDPDEAWKCQLRKKITESLEAMVEEVVDRYTRQLAKDDLSAQARANLEEEYKGAMDNITTIGAEQYDFELARERNQRRLVRGLPVSATWSRTLTEEQLNMFKDNQVDDDGVPITNPFEDRRWDYDREGEREPPESEDEYDEEYEDQEWSNHYPFPDPSRIRSQDYEYDDQTTPIIYDGYEFGGHPTTPPSPSDKWDWIPDGIRLLPIPYLKEKPERDLDSSCPYLTGAIPVPSRRLHDNEDMGGPAWNESHRPKNRHHRHGRSSPPAYNQLPYRDPRPASYGQNYDHEEGDFSGDEEIVESETDESGDQDDWFAQLRKMEEERRRVNAEAAEIQRLQDIEMRFEERRKKEAVERVERSYGKREDEERKRAEEEARKQVEERVKEMMKKEEELKKTEREAQEKERNAKRKIEEAQKLMVEAGRREAELKRKEDEVRRREEEARMMIEEAKKLQEEAGKKAMAGPVTQEALRHRQEDPRKKEKETESALRLRKHVLRTRRRGARIWEEEARRKNGEAKKKEVEVKRKEQDVQRKEDELRKKEEEVRKREDAAAKILRMQSRRRRDNDLDANVNEARPTLLAQAPVRKQKEEEIKCNGTGRQLEDHGSGCPEPGLLCTKSEDRPPSPSPSSDSIWTIRGSPAITSLNRQPAASSSTVPAPPSGMQSFRRFPLAATLSRTIFRG